MMLNHTVSKDGRNHSERYNIEEEGEKIGGWCNKTTDRESK